MSVRKLAEMVPGQEADLFVLLVAKEELTTKTGKPYFRVTFRDATREVTFPIWSDGAWAAECREQWTPGTFYKLRAVYRETNYGPQLEIRKIREVNEADRAAGFDPAEFRPHSRFDPEQMFAELLALAREQITEPALRQLVESLLVENRAALLNCPAGRRKHHAFVGGLLEHTLSVARTCVYLADKYAQYYPDLRPPLRKSLAVAGGILHDIGKIHEIEFQAEEAVHTPAGALLGHMLLGRDMVRQAAAQVDLDPETQLRLEHLVIAHQRLPEWGSPKPPMTPEALIVHYADDLDAKFAMMADILRTDTSAEPLLTKKNVLMQPVYRGTVAEP